MANPDTIAPFLDAVPVAARDLPSGIPLQATLPVRVSARRAAAVNCAATLIGPDGAARDMGCQARSVDVLSTAAGGRFQIALPPLPPGNYRLRVEMSARGARSERREIAFSVR